MLITRICRCRPRPKSSSQRTYMDLNGGSSTYTGVCTVQSPSPLNSLSLCNLWCLILQGQPRRHLLTTGWSTFVTSKKLIAGDAFVYLRLDLNWTYTSSLGSSAYGTVFLFLFSRSETGQQRVGVRRLVQKQSTMPASVISSQSMHLGVLASASHAIRTHSIFLVYYRPRLDTSWHQFS